MNDKQMQTYIIWINSQLRKRPGSRYIQDLDDDMRDGVAFLQLIEVIAGETVPFIEFPASKSEMRANINKVLQFMAKRRIKMHNTTPKEIVDGNIKAIMRLVLALAAHFKPHGMKADNPVPSGSPSKMLDKAPSTMSLAADAAAALADASEAASSAGLSLHFKLRNRQSISKRSITPSKLPRSPRSDSDTNISVAQKLMPSSKISGTSSLSPQSGHRTISPANSNSSGTGTPVIKPFLVRMPAEQANSKERIGRRTNSSSASDDVNLIRKLKELNNNGSRSHSRQNSDLSQDSFQGTGGIYFDSLEDFLYDQSLVLNDLASTKDTLANLQNLLLNGVAEDEEEQPQDLYLDASSLQEQVIVLSARLDRRNCEYDLLKDDYFKLREDIVELQGEKSGLMTRLSCQEQLVLELRGDLQRQEFMAGSLSAEKEEALRGIEERDEKISYFHHKLGAREEELAAVTRDLAKLKESMVSRDNTEADLHAQLETRECETEQLQRQVHELTDRLDAIGNCEASITSKLAAYQDKLSLFEEAVTSARENGKICKEYGQLFEILGNLRMNFAKHDSRQHAIDSIEQTLNSLIEKVTVAESTKPPEAEVLPTPNGNLTTKPKLATSGLQGKLTNGDHQKGWKVRIETTPSTKVVYFANKAVTPFLKIVKKRIGEITLADFKSVVNKIGRQRYFFKSLDPEFGSVREELISDDEIIPGWDDKIVAWVEDEVEESWISKNQSFRTIRDDIQEDVV